MCRQCRTFILDNQSRCASGHRLGPMAIMANDISPTSLRSEMGYRLCLVGLEWDIVFEGIRECMNVLLIYCVVLNPNDFFKKIVLELEMDFKNSFCKQYNWGKYF